MAKTVSLQVSQRAGIGRTALKAVRNAGRVPGVLYGRAKDKSIRSRPIEIDSKNPKEIDDPIGSVLKKVVAAMAGMDSGALYLNVLTAHVDQAMDLLADVAQHPAFRPEDVERDRKQRLVHIGQETDNVTSMAMRVGP